MKKYDEIKFQGLDWYVIDFNNDEVKLLLKDVLDEERIKKYSDDDFMINKHEVRHQDNIREFDWDKSYIKNTILPNFKNDLNIECEVDLLKKEEVENLQDEIKKCNDWYWTKTKNSSNAYDAFFVISSGYVYYIGNAYDACGVRPVVVLKSDIFLSEEARQESCNEKIEKEIEKIKIDEKNRIQALSTGNFVYKVNQPTKIIIYKINELIDELKKLKRCKDE